MNRKILFLSIASLVAVQSGAHAQDIFTPGSLLVSSSIYEGTASTVTVGQALTGTATAGYDGAYPEVFNNVLDDENFGVTSPIFINQISTSGAAVNINNPNSLSYISGNTISVPTSVAVTSFSSKSELGLNVSTDGTAITFMGYDAAANSIGAAGGSAINQLEISNSNTPGDSESPVSIAPATYREAVQLNLDGSLQTTQTNAYSQNNSRSVILVNTGGQNLYYMAGNGASATYSGAQTLVPGQTTTSSTPTSPLGSLAIGGKGNFRGEAIDNNVLFLSKGSGSSGVNSIYQVENGSTAASPTGTGNTLPTGSSNTIIIAPGMPGSSSHGSNVTGNFAPFGIWFANSTTMYVADEGYPPPSTPSNSGADSAALTAAAADANAGLEKWTFDGTRWNLIYTLQLGLNIGQLYSVAGLPSEYDPATVGLRNLTGEVNGDGTVTLFATTSTLSDLGDPGADPNELVSITDNIAATSETGESFTTLEGPEAGTVLRGVSFTPVPEPSSMALLLLAGGAYAGAFRRRKAAR